MPESVTLEVGGRTMVIETGELAKQANGSALIRYGEQNVVLCAVTASAETSRRHRLVPPHLRFRREDVRGRKDSGRLHQARRTSARARRAQLASDRSSDSSALPRRFPKRRASRCDRTLGRSRTRRRRPRHLRRGRSARAFATFRSIRPVAGVRVGRDENGNYICNPTLPQYETGGMEIVVAGTADAIMMVEGGGKKSPRKISSARSNSRTARSRRSSKRSINSRKRPAKTSASIRSRRSTPISTSGCARRLPRTSPKRCASSTSTRAKKRSRDINVDEALERVRQEGRRRQSAARESGHRAKSSARSSRRWKKTSCA